MMKSFLNWMWGLAAPVLILVAVGSSQGRGLYDRPAELERLIAALLADNEELQSMAAEEAALAAEISVAGALDDPRLGIGLANMPTDTFSFSQEPMTQKQLFIAQKFPWFGKLDLRTQRAALVVERQRALIEARRLDLVKALSGTYYELGFVSRSLRVNMELIQMAEQMLRVAEAGYASGRTLQQDVFQAQVELGKLFDEQVSLEKRRQTLAARINELINRPDFMEVKGPPSPDFVEIDLDPDTVGQLALTHHPMLRVRQTDIDRAAVTIELARKDYFPDMDVRLGYGQRDEDFNGRDLPDFLSASVTVSVPLWRQQKQDKQLTAAENRHKAAIKSYANLRLALPHQVDAVLSEIAAIRENHRLFTGGLLEQTRNWSLSTLSAYEVGKLDFDTMINAHLRALRFELQAERYRFQYYQRLVELEALAGITLKDLPWAKDSLSPAPIELSAKGSVAAERPATPSSGVNP